MSQESVSASTCPDAARPEHQSQREAQANVIAQHNHQPGYGQLQRGGQADQFQFQYPRSSPAKGDDGSQVGQQWPAEAQHQFLIGKHLAQHDHCAQQGDERAHQPEAQAKEADLRAGRCQQQGDARAPMLLVLADGLAHGRRMQAAQPSAGRADAGCLRVPAVAPATRTGDAQRGADRHTLLAWLLARAATSANCSGRSNGQDD